MSLNVQRDFFISYTSADTRWAEWIAWQLEEAGYSVILQAWDFRPGANFVSEMERAVSHVKRTIAVLTTQYLSALYTQPEWAAAFRRDPKGEQGILVPVRVEECELTGLLGQIIYINLVGRDEGSASKLLLAGVRHERAKPHMAPDFPQRVQHTVSKQLSFPGELPSIWHVPYPRDPLFVGREQVLQDLHTVLHTQHQAALTSSPAGSDFSSIDVKETALEYTYRYQSDYHAILWMHASSRETLLSDFVSIASLLKVPENSVQREDEMANAVKRWLDTHTHWLLVLEDVQNPEVVAAFIPSLNHGSLLLTTHVSSVSHLFPRVKMDRLKPEEQTLLLQLSRTVGATLSSAQRRLPLGLERVTIGRAQDNQIVLSDSTVSSHHAEILLKQEGYWITDVGSTNGTFVNQQKIDKHVPTLLNPRDVIRISTTTFTYEVTETASRKLAVSPMPALVHTSSEQEVLPTPFDEANTGEYVGKQLGNYRLVRLIGEGGFAEVYLAQHIHLDTQAAIKILFTKLAKNDMETFRQEARTIARLVHPHIVRVFDFDVVGTTPFLVMDYAPGDTLRELHPKGSRLPLETVVSYVKQVAAALDYAHEQQVIHRDVKPENMLMGRHGEVLLSDFGIALITQSSRYKNAQDIAGTIAYMAPEQIEAHPRPASDQYSLGIVVYEWLTGDRPFHGSFSEIAGKHSVVSPPSLIEQVPALPSAVEQVVLIALAKDPKQRFGSVLAFATALEQACKVAQPEPEPVVSVSVPADANPPSQPEMAVPVDPSSSHDAEDVIPTDTLPQQNVSEVAEAIAVEPHTAIRSLNEERQRLAEEEKRRQAAEERRQRRVEQAKRARLATEMQAQDSMKQTPPKQDQTLPQASTPHTAISPERLDTLIPPQIPRQPKRWRSPAVIAVLILLALILIGGVSFGIYRTFIWSPWHAQASGTTRSLSEVAWGDSQFVVVGDRGTILTSPDGHTWTAQNSGTSELLVGIAWSGSLFVTAGDNGTILTSPDGHTWTAQNSGTNQQSFYAVAWLGSQFVAVGNSAFLTSPDGHTWTAQNSGTSDWPPNAVAWSGSQFVAVGGDGVSKSYILTSPDGRTWTSQDTSTLSKTLLGVVWANSQFVAVGLSGTILTSPDGHTWTAQNTGTWEHLFGVAWLDSQFVVAGIASIHTSPDGRTWTSQNAGTSVALYSVAWSGNLFVVVGDNGTILTSP